MRDAERCTYRGEFARIGQRDCWAQRENIHSKRYSEDQRGDCEIRNSHYDNLCEIEWEAMGNEWGEDFLPFLPGDDFPKKFVGFEE